ncbi:MAG: Holliday junction DNA helicase RuvA [Coxiella sp. RIFCSPHIGHO2_12_FULL_44_14]|nr:MAG: Holliday junction DNA helicase RuvA [Coxiella sp. RIFCSPHIGHO2_12_FULL_44_14]
MDNSKTHQVLLGFDFGMKRIGVAVGQTLTNTAQALPILTAKDGIPDWQRIENLITTWHPSAFVVGIPYNMNGTEQNTTFAARKFAHRLKQKFNLPVHPVDERLTTVEAKALQPVFKKKSSDEIDSYAAKLILESWLREQR